MRRLLLIVTALLLLAAMVPPLTGEAQAAEGAGINNPVQQWKLWANSNHPAVFGTDGTIYLGGDDLYAMTPAGTMKWKFNIPGGGFYADAQPAVGMDGTIYASFMPKSPMTAIEDRMSYLVAVKPDGTMKWKYETGSLVSSQPVVSTDGTIYVRDFGGKLYAFNPDGTMKWSLQVANIEYGQTAQLAVAGDGTVYSTCTQGLCAIGTDGKVKWSYPKSGLYPYAAPNGQVYSLNNAGYLAVNAADGTELKLLDLHASSFTIGANGTIYAGVGSNMNAYTADGALIWSVPTAGGVGQAVISPDGTVYFGSYDEHVYAVDAAGNLKWLYFAGTGKAIHYGTAILDYGSYFLGINPTVAVGANGTVYVNSYETFANPSEPGYQTSLDPNYPAQIFALVDQGGTPTNKRIVPDPSYVKATTGMFEIRLTGEYGSESAGVKVSAVDANGAVAATGTTDSRGKAALEVAQEGIYTVRAEMEGYQTSSSQAMLLFGQITRMGMVMKTVKDGAIHFVLTNGANNTPINGAQVKLTNLKTQAAITASTDAQGEAYFYDVPEGDYLMTADKYPFQTLDTGEWISPKPYQQDFNWQMSYPPVTVKFVGKDGQPTHTAVIYRLLTLDQQGMTNMYDSAEFYDLAPGTYQLAILDRNYQEGKPIKFVVTDTKREFTVIRTDDGNGIMLEGQSAEEAGSSGGPAGNGGTPANSSTSPGLSGTTSTQPNTKLRNTVFINGTAQTFSAKPVIVGGTTFVPMRSIFQALHADVVWEQARQQVNAQRGTMKLSITIGSKSATLNGKPFTLLQAPFMQKGTTMVPLRFVSEALGADVKWDSKTGNIYITDPTLK
ncbi:hypothetical protein PCCS19_50910 [Paenibacillus sp. CCS19]|uniref:stalk domain-containing protein n=1 Tax=Paenibacillus sp. CCS19 TaxID=3158387 RepID=UPI00255E20B3|nr:stalk domain-containing protein [Paenibacillus cellulosilyticus]GMK42032.1 hypothetical protein PCCS19_50910 [Paenibacillus cellulosilyticus]